MNATEALLILNAIPDLGPVRIQNLLQHFAAPEQIFKMSLKDLEQVGAINKDIAYHINNWQKIFDLQKELQQIKRDKIKIITIRDEDYPGMLKEIHDPPVVLYLKGVLTGFKKRFIAIVGARRASYYGLSTAKKLGEQLARYGFIIVSGLARGVDTAAHEGALLGGGCTVAVFGCGLDQVYPRENKSLATRIADQGAIMTEFPLGTPPHRANFPKRNRIISGLSIGVVVVEAGERSGSLITARLAAEQGKEVFSVPGRIDALTSVGTNILIRHGACPVTSVQDILEDLNYTLGIDKASAGSGPVRDQDKAAINQEISLTDIELKLMQGLQQEEMVIETIVTETGLSLPEVYKGLTDLELKGLVKRLPGSKYTKVL